MRSWRTVGSSASAPFLEYLARFPSRATSTRCRKARSCSPTSRGFGSPPAGGGAAAQDAAAQSDQPGDDGRRGGGDHAGVRQRREDGPAAGGLLATARVMLGQLSRALKSLDGAPEQRCADAEIGPTAIRAHSISRVTRSCPGRSAHYHRRGAALPSTGANERIRSAIRRPRGVRSRISGVRTYSLGQLATPTGCFARVRCAINDARPPLSVDRNQRRDAGSPDLAAGLFVLDGPPGKPDTGA